jgi:dolichol-phosphate mannosyltransferase
MSGAAEFAYRLGAAARQPANWVQLLKFGLVGGSGYFVNLAVFALLVETASIHHAAAAVGAFCVAVTNNFVWNRHWTFGPGEGDAHRQAVRFLTVSVASLCVNLIALQALVATGAVGEVAAQAIAVAVAMPFNFLGNRLWTFA